MNDGQNTPASQEDGIADEQAGRPDWEARERADMEESDDDWDPTPPSFAATTSENETAAETQGEDDKGSAGSSFDAGTNLDMSRFDMVDDDAEENGATSSHSEESHDAGGSGADDDSDAGTERDEGSDVDGNADSEDGVEAEAPVQALPVVDLPENWEQAPRQVVTRWSDRAGRHTGFEAFKTGLVLPLLSSLGYDVFDPDGIEPLEDETGRLDGYLAKSERGLVVVLLEDADIPDDHRGEVTMRTRRDRLAVGVRIEQEGSEPRWQPVLEMELVSDAPVSGLRHVHHDAFDKAAVISMAEQVQGQQEDILEAVRHVITEPGNGFVEDVRRQLSQQGHDNPVMLPERISLAVSRMLSGPVTEEEVEEEESGRRRLSPAESRAVEIIREMCAPEIDPSDIVPRPGQAYTAVLYKDNNRRTIARLHFSAATVKNIGLISDGNETKERIENVEDIRSHRDAIRARAAELDPDAFPAEPDEEQE